MGIEGMQSAGLGGLEAFQRLRDQARAKLAQPSAPLANPPVAANPSVAKSRGSESTQSAFDAAKAEILKTAVSYQRTGETNKAQSAPRLGQYVDLVA
jgi:hypothetical protein